MKTTNLSTLPTINPDINEAKGSYRSHFFGLAKFSVATVDFSSQFYSDVGPEAQILAGDRSFYYLRDNKLRMIDISLNNGPRLKFDDFARHFGIKIQSTNLFKTGKYLSRVFRPIKYGGFFPKLNIRTSHLTGKIVDGISLISVDLAKAVGWADAQHGMSAQFTLFFAEGLVKGHCVVSGQIDHDVIIYGEENIKKEIKFDYPAEYVALEPVGLSDTLRMDIQTLLNLWDLFKADQYLSWAYQGIQQFKSDLMTGKLDSWLDSFNDADIEEVLNEKWTLKKAILHKIDYTRYPGLIRTAWTMYRNSILTFSADKEGKPVFHIPVPGGKRGYIRVDLRNHDKDGNFTSTVKHGTVELDKHGNLWIHKDDIERFMLIKGGADQDDGVGIIPVEDNKAVIYRNPNQYGEYGIYPIEYNEVDISARSKVIGTVPIKDIDEESEVTLPNKKTINKISNALFDRVIPALTISDSLAYTKINLIRAYCNLRMNSASIGLAANAEMLRTAILLKDQKKKKILFSKTFKWNLEKIIDAAVKEGFGANEDMEAVNSLFEYIAETKITIPHSLSPRIPERLRNGIPTAKNHPLDELFNALKMLIDRADIEVLGRGSVSKGNRIPGVIDYLDIPVEELGLSALEHPCYDLAVNLLKGYNRNIAILLESTKDEPNSEYQRQQGIAKIQTSFLEQLTKHTQEERAVFTSIWAYEIYKTSSAVHDSILWISDNEKLSGTSNDTVQMLCNLKLGMHIKSNGSLQRHYERVEPLTDIKTVRVWSKEQLIADQFTGIESIIIDGGTVVMKDLKLNLGDETKIPDGFYPVKTVSQSVSKKNTRMLLKNSLTIYLS